MRAISNPRLDQSYPSATTQRSCARARRGRPSGGANDQRAPTRVKRDGCWARSSFAPPPQRTTRCLNLPGRTMANQASLQSTRGPSQAKMCAKSGRTQRQPANRPPSAAPLFLARSLHCALGCEWRQHRRDLGRIRPRFGPIQHIVWPILAHSLAISVHSVRLGNAFDQVWPQSAKIWPTTARIWSNAAHVRGRNQPMLVGNQIVCAGSAQNSTEIAHSWPTSANCCRNSKSTKVWFNSVKISRCRPKLHDGAPIYSISGQFR